MMINPNGTPSNHSIVNVNACLMVTPLISFSRNGTCFRYGSSITARLIAETHLFAGRHPTAEDAAHEAEQQSRDRPEGRVPERARRFVFPLVHFLPVGRHVLLKL